MSYIRSAFTAATLFLMISMSFTGINAEDKLTLTTAGDFVSRYNWRGIDFGDAVAIQPTLAMNYKGIEFGFWGSYSSEFKELDTWASFTYQIPNSISLSAIVTDYYFPDSTGEFFNFNNYDDPDGPGKHTMELGLVLTGPEKFPVSVAGYVNVHNDGGNCAYFQVDYPLTINETSVGLFAGMTPGSKENPGFYGSRDAVFLNVGAKVSREIKISEGFSLPVFGSIILNPNSEEAFLIFGFSL